MPRKSNLAVELDLQKEIILAFLHVANSIFADADFSKLPWALGASGFLAAASEATQVCMLQAAGQ